MCIQPVPTRQALGSSRMCWWPLRCWDARMVVAFPRKPQPVASLPVGVAERLEQAGDMQEWRRVCGVGCGVCLWEVCVCAWGSQDGQSSLPAPILQCHLAKLVTTPGPPANSRRPTTASQPAALTGGLGHRKWTVPAEPPPPGSPLAPRHGSGAGRPRASPWASP